MYNVIEKKKKFGKDTMSFTVNLADGKGSYLSGDERPKVAPPTIIHEDSKHPKKRGKHAQKEKQHLRQMMRDYNNKGDS